MAKATPKEAAKVRSSLIKIYVSAVKKLKRVPTEAEMRERGVTRHKVRYHFKNPQALKQAAMGAAPEAFEHIIDESIFTDENMENLEQRMSNASAAVVFSAVTGCKVHKGFYRTLKSYAEKHNAVPLCIPVTDPAADASWNLSPDLDKESIVFGDLALNSNIYINGIKMSAKQIDPTWGLKRMSHRMSFIFGSPKQRLIVKANSNLKHPHVSMGTGAVTLPNYSTSRYMSERTAKLAEFDHKVGAVVVELDSDEKYYFRQIQASASGSFADLGQLYMPDGRVVPYAPAYFVMGDLHPGETDPKALACWKEVIQETGAENVVVHDGVNGHSISHWVEGKIIEKALMAKKGMTNLAEEGKLCAQYFTEILSWLPATGKIYMVASNHNDFLYRYLNDKRFVRDYENFDFVAQNLLPKVLQGEDPAKVLVELFLSLEAKARIIWWKEDEDVRFAGVQLAAHGDRGPNGSRGTLRNQEESFGPCVVGHSHTPGILREAFQVGTSTFRKLGYSGGPSSWMQTSCLVYPNSSRQLINCIDGKWRLKAKKKV